MNLTAEEEGKIVIKKLENLKVAMSPEDDNKKEKKMMQERINQLTAHMKDMQKILDQLITLNDSLLPQEEDKEELREDAIISEYYYENTMKQQVLGMKLKMQLQQKMHEQEKLNWVEERRQLVKELDDCKYLLKNNRAKHTSTPNTSGSTADVAGSQNVLERKILWKKYKCHKCRFLCSSANSLLQHQKTECNQIPDYLCSICGQQFQQKPYFVIHMADVHDIFSFKMGRGEAIKEVSAIEEIEKKKQSIAKTSQQSKTESEQKSVVQQIENEDVQIVVIDSSSSMKSEKQNYCPTNLSSTTTNLKQPTGQLLAQKIQKPAPVQTTSTAVEETAKIMQNKMNISEQPGPSSATSLADPGSKVQAIMPTKEMTDDKIRLQLRQIFLSQLKSHNCNNSECTVITFRNHVEHVTTCLDSYKCSWFICDCIQKNKEHHKICYRKDKCSICKLYTQFQDVKVHRMMALLMKGCPSYMKFKHEIALAMKNTITNMVTRLAVRSGLIDCVPKILNTEISQEEKTDCQSVEPSLDSATGSIDGNAKTSDTEMPLQEIKNMTECESVKSSLNSTTGSIDSNAKTLDTEIPPQEVESKTDWQIVDLSSDCSNVLVDNNAKTSDTESSPQVEDANDCQVNDSASESSSLSEDWEVVEAEERRMEID